MTVEKDFSSELGYKKLEFVEFLEMVVRVAIERYKMTEMQLYEKVERVLDTLLPLVGAERREIQRRVEVKLEFEWSESDEQEEESEPEEMPR